MLKILLNPIFQKTILAVAILASLWILWTSNKRLSVDNQRLSENLQTLSIGMGYVKTQNGNLAAQTNILILRMGELQSLFPSQARSIQNMGVKLSRVTLLSTTVIGSEKHIVTMLRDSVMRDTIHVKVFSYKDTWYDILGIATGDTQIVQIHSSDTLTQVVYRGERIRPWLWFFSKRKLQQRVSLSNPNATIKYSNLIQIQKP